MDDNDQPSGDPLPAFDVSALAGADETLPYDLELLAIASKIFKQPRWRTQRHRDLAESFMKLGRIFDNVETLQLRCSVLEAEKMQAQHATEARLQDAFERIQDLEEVVSGLLRLVAKYDALLVESTGRTREALIRADHAEVKARQNDRGVSDAVEWIYRYMARSPNLPG